MSDPMNRNDGGIHISGGATVGGFAVGNNAIIRSIIQSSPIQHPQADELKEKLEELAESINDSEIPDFKKRDALSRLEQLAKELEKEDTSDRKSGIKYFLGQIVNIFDSAKPIVDLASTIAKLVGFSL